MAKIIAPPVINDLTELLDLVLHPDKYVAYLTQLTEMRDAILETLGTVKTKEDADQYLAMARQKSDEASALLTKATADADAAAEMVKQGQAEVSHRMRQQEDYAQARSGDLQALEHVLSVRQKSLDEREAYQVGRQQELDGLATVLASKDVYLTEQLDKLKSTKAYLSAQGV